MSRRAEWILVVCDPRVAKHSPTYKLARVVGVRTAARWEKIARDMAPAALARKAAAAGKEHPGW